LLGELLELEDDFGELLDEEESGELLLEDEDDPELLELSSEVPPCDPLVPVPLLEPPGRLDPPVAEPGVMP